MSKHLLTEEYVSKTTYFTVPEAAELLCVDVTTVRRWIYEGVIPKEDVKINATPDPKTNCRYFISRGWLESMAQKTQKKVTAKIIKTFYTFYNDMGNDIGQTVNEIHDAYGTPKDEIIQKMTLPAREAAKRLGISYNTIREWVKNDIIYPCTFHAQDIGLRFETTTIQALSTWMGRYILRRKEIKQDEQSHHI